MTGSGLCGLSVIAITRSFRAIGPYRYGTPSQTATEPYPNLSGFFAITATEPYPIANGKRPQYMQSCAFCLDITMWHVRVGFGDLERGNRARSRRACLRLETEAGTLLDMGVTDCRRGLVCLAGGCRLPRRSTTAVMRLRGFGDDNGCSKRGVPSASATKKPRLVCDRGSH